MELYNLFPKAVIRQKLGREFTEGELHMFEVLSENTKPNMGNASSQNDEVFNLPELSSIKEIIDSHIKEYFEKVFSAPETVKPYITLSWANFTKPGQYHHKHCHGNSILSGVLYINADSNVDRIQFYNDTHQSIEIVPSEYNIYNSSSWWIPVGKGDVLLFPSDMVHSVPVNQSEYIRSSIAFNVFVKGQIGSRGDLKWLELN